MVMTYKRSYEQLKVYINDELHLLIKLLDLVGFQTWIHGESEYFIEYYFSSRDKITTVYGTRELFSKVLKILDETVTSDINKTLSKTI